nr:hypothetical protein Iba_chr13eCG0040 [Ipomoea batatas]
MVSQSVSTNPDVCLNVAQVPVQHHPPSALEVTTVGSLAAPSSSGPALSPRTSHLASVPSSPVFANQSPEGLVAPNSSIAVDLQEPSRSERVSPPVEAACSEETVEAVRSVHAPGSMPAPSTQAGSLSASSAQASSMQDGDSGAMVTTGQAAIVAPLRRSNRHRRPNPNSTIILFHNSVFIFPFFSASPPYLHVNQSINDDKYLQMIIVKMSHF